MSAQSIYRSSDGAAEIMALYDRVLAKSPVLSEQGEILTRHGATFVLATGDPSAPPIVLLHGSASNAASWLGEMAALGEHYRVYAADIPGEPGKSSRARFSWEGDAFVEWLDDVLDGLNLARSVLGGMSLGGWATLRYAIDRPARVAAAIAICPSGVVPPRMTFVLRMVGFTMLGAWGRRRMIRSIFNGAEIPSDLEQFMILVDRHFRYRTGAPPLFTDAELQRLAMPVLFLAGENDVLLDTPKTATRLRRLIPDLTVHISAEDGHAVLGNAPAIAAFLDAQLAGAATPECA